LLTFQKDDGNGTNVGVGLEAMVAY